MQLELLIPIFGIFLVMIPVAGLTFTLTLRFAAKPFVETLAQALRESGSLGGGSSSQIEALSEHVESLTAEVQRLAEAQRFDRELLTERTVPIEQP
jgi:hypothetical protein